MIGGMTSMMGLALSSLAPSLTMLFFTYGGITGIIKSLNYTLYHEAVQLLDRVGLFISVRALFELHVVDRGHFGQFQQEARHRVLTQPVRCWTRNFHLRSALQFSHQRIRMERSFAHHWCLHSPADLSRRSDIPVKKSEGDRSHQFGEPSSHRRGEMHGRRNQSDIAQSQLGSSCR